MQRRAWLKQSTLFLASVWGARSSNAAETKVGSLRFGLMTDLHHADKPAGGTRFYRETISKLDEAASKLRGQNIEFIVELGDLIDAAESVETELDYLKTIEQHFAQVNKQRYYVLGNHCVDTLTKEEFLGEVGQKDSYLSFDVAGWHFVILDACFRADMVPYGRKNSQWNDANIPPAELEWLEADLKSTSSPTIVFAHQRLDVANDHGIKNAIAIRKIFEASGKVTAVFQGHSHKNDYKDIEGIHYCTLKAMVEGSGPENNGYSFVQLNPDRSLELHGFRMQQDYRW